MNTCLVTTMLSQFFLFAVKGDFEPKAVLALIVTRTFVPQFKNFTLLNYCFM